MELSYENKRRLLMAALNPSNDYRMWIKDFSSDRVVFEDEEVLFEASYSIVDGNVTIGDRQPVRVDYVPLAEMKDIEVLETGTHTSMTGEAATYTKADLDLISKNEAELKEIVKPVLAATHAEGTDITVQVFGSVHGGVFHNLRRVGNKLIADLKNIPKKAIDLLGEVEEFRLSPEIYKNYRHKGKSYGLALRRAVWTPIPAVKTLKPITAANLYEEAPDQPTTWVKLHEPNQNNPRKGKKTMDPNEQQEKFNSFQEQIVKLNEKMTGLQTENEGLKKEKNTALTKLSERDSEARSNSIKEMVKPLRDAGLAPAKADQIEAFAETLGTDIVKFGEKDVTRV